MHFPILLSLSFAAFQLTHSLPLPQGAGVGAGCDSILSDADTGTGLLVKEAGTNAASLLKSGGARVKRQGAGVGAGCNAILSDADTGTGLLVKEAGTNAASLLKSAGAKERRQLDKVGAGVAAVVGVVSPQLAGVITEQANTLDGDGTGDAALLGQQVGQELVNTGTEIGNLVPSKVGRRQLDKAGAGVAAVVNLASPQLAGDITTQANTLDGDGTGDAALIGQQVGQEEVNTGTEAGILVPSKVPAPL